MDESLVLNVEQAGKLLGLSRGSAYSAVRNGSLPAIRIGNRWLVPKLAIERLLAKADKTVGAPDGE